MTILERRSEAQTGTESGTEAAASPSLNGGGTNPLLGCLAVVALFVAVNALWLFFDKRVPSTDEAGHILNALQYKELFRHFYFWKPDWLHQFFSINPFYPPAVYVYDGFLKWILGNARWVDNLCFLSYIGILTAGMYAITWRLSRSMVASVVASLTINLYPQIANLSHYYMLDLPMTAMVAAGVAALLWWNERPTWTRSILTGSVLTIACFTKQLDAAYLIPPCLFLLLKRKPDYQGAAQYHLKLLSIGAMVSALMLPWLWTNIAWIRDYARENAAHMQGAQVAPISVFADYLVGLGYSMSPLLVLAFAACTLVIPLHQHRRNLPVYMAAMGGLVLTSLLSCTFPLDRYAAPVLIAPALVTGTGAACLFNARNKLSTALIVSLVGLLALLQYFSFCFAPNPVSNPALSSLSGFMRIELREFRGARITKSCPNDQSGWAQDWVAETINRVDKTAPVWLNILPSTGIYNPHSFELLAKEKRLSLRPTTSRRWTIMGDQVQFSPTTACYYQWYLIKTGEQGNRLCDDASRRDYDRLIDFVTRGGKFTQIGTRELPDGSTLSLYRMH